MDFGCRLSSYDVRDYKVKAGSTLLPDTYTCPVSVKVKNQGSVSSCVAHAVSSILEYHTGATVSLSTNFIYGMQKELFGREDRGMFLRDACKIVTDYGDMSLEDCPGNTEVPKCHDIASKAFADNEKLKNAFKFHTLKYFTCSTNDEIKHALVNYGPVLASLKWYDTFKVGIDGTLKGEEKGDYGYHAIMIYGYTPEGFWCQNSWGKLWGKGGKFFVPNSIKFREARGFVDCAGCAHHDDIYVPKRNKFFDILYKCINIFVNFFTKIFSKK